MPWTKITKKEDEGTGYGVAAWGTSPWGGYFSQWIKVDKESDTWTKIT